MFKWLKRKYDIENISIEENTDIFLQDFEELVKTSNPLTIRKFIKFLASSVQGELVTKCAYNDRNYISYFENIKNSFLVDTLCKEDNKYNTVVNVAETPLISCIWNHTRMINALRNISMQKGNPFNGMENADNIRAYQIKSLGLVIVRNGNHSVNSAIVHGEGEIFVNTLVDITPALNKYKFNGREYIEIETNKKIDSSFMKNNSEPLTYTLGIMFEMTRILKGYGY